MKHLLHTYNKDNKKDGGAYLYAFLNMQIGIIGAGTWGTALGLLLNSNGHKVTMWSHNVQAIKEMMNNQSHKNLPGIIIPEEIILTNCLKRTVSNQDFVIMAVPSVHTRSVAQKMQPYVVKDQIIVNVSKGIEHDTLMTISAQIEEELPIAQVAVLSGPSHAEEVARGLPTTCVAAAQNEQVAKSIQEAFMNETFRVYTSSDVIGVEIGAALKNVIALAAGIADGLGCGDNTKAALITRGIAEIGRLGIKMGGKPETFAGLTGIGDLIVTCASQHSRNRKAGYLMGQGYSMNKAVAEVGMVVEGINSAKAALALAQKYNESMPIVEQVNAVLFNNKTAAQGLYELMVRDGRAEHKNVQ